MKIGDKNLIIKPKGKKIIRKCRICGATREDNKEWKFPKQN
jgi:hypothetical protein